MATILVIDDDDSMRQAIILMLKTAQHEATGAAGTREALQTLATQMPDIVVTDLLMPERDGIETIRLLRKRAPSARIIAITGGDPQMYGKSYAATLLDFASQMGADAALQKPFDSHQLIAAVDQLLGR
jgi:CheY-like chemotaxis protein